MSEGFRIMEALAAKGWGVFTDVLPAELLDALLARATALENEQAAAVGKSNRHRFNRFVRRDEVVWVRGAGAAEHSWLSWIDTMRWC